MSLPPPAERDIVVEGVCVGQIVVTPETTNNGQPAVRLTFRTDWVGMWHAMALSTEKGR